VSGFYEHGNEPSSSINKVHYSLTSGVTISFSKDILHHGVRWLKISRLYVTEGEVITVG